MKLGNSLKLGAWLLIVLNVLMALGSVWVFMRMAPAIKLIIKNNEHSLEASGKMMMTLASIDPNSPEKQEKLKKQFTAAMKQIKKNIGDEELYYLEIISNNYQKAFNGDITAKESTVRAIAKLSEINRKSILNADSEARQYGSAGAWGVVFMGTVIFFVGMIFMQRLKKRMLQPVEEIYSVITAVKKGDKMRRCTGADMSSEMNIIFDGINSLLDK
ncbi:MAG: hypothetical protein ACQES9_05400 [Myxococcota bacterium]